MKIAIEAPICWGVDPLINGDFIFVVPKMEPYLDKINEIRKDRLVMLDNGSFEKEPLTNQRLYDLIMLLKPNVVFLPDVIGNFNLTLKASKEFLNFFLNKKRRPAVEFGFIHQGDLSSLQDTLTFMSKYRIKYLGLPYWLNRSYVIRKFLKSFTDKIHIHLLGLENPFELLNISYYVSHNITLDTSLPVIAAIERMDFSKGDIPSKNKDVFSIGTPFTEEINTLLKKNIQFLKSLAKRERTAEIKL